MKILQPIDPNERFHERRRQARRRLAFRRLSLLALVALAAAGLTLAARSVGGGEKAAVPDEAATAAPPVAEAPVREITVVPEEIRGVHVTMALASLPGKLDEYLDLAAYGLNTIELDVKDENGQVGFVWPRVPLAQRVGAARPFYRAVEVAKKLESRGVYLIGRVVVFEDPRLAEGRPQLAIRTRDGAVWQNASGLGWTNPYDRRVWKYNVDVAEAAVRAGFDEIMFDYVRFPTDGDLTSAVFPGRRAEPKAATIAAFLSYAQKRLKPLGANVSAAVFGLSATRNLGIGQAPRKLAAHLDAVYPMVYPSHYGSGEYNIDDPNAQPGRIVAFSLKDFRRDLAGAGTSIVPWLQDFSLGRRYTLADVRAQIDAARRQNVRGFLLWNPEGVYTPEALAAR